MYIAFDVKNSAGEDDHAEILSSCVKDLIGSTLALQLRNLLTEFVEFNKKYKNLVSAQIAKDEEFPLIDFGMIYEKPKNIIAALYNFLDSYSRQSPDLPARSRDSIFFPEKLEEFFSFITTLEDKESGEKIFASYEVEYRKIAEDFFTFLNRIYQLTVTPERLDDSEEIFRNIKEKIIGMPPARVYKASALVPISDETSIKNFTIAIITEYAAEEITAACNGHKAEILTAFECEKKDMEKAEALLAMNQRVQEMEQQMMEMERRMADTQEKRQRTGDDTGTAVLRLEDTTITLHAPSHEVAAKSAEVISKKRAREAGKSAE